MKILDCLTPSSVRVLPENSRERALGQLALRRLWHMIYDPCPRLLAASPPDGRLLLESFLEHASTLHLSMNWALHGHMLSWLRGHHPDLLNADLAEELSAASAARWAYSDQTANLGCLLHVPDLMPETAVAAWKSESPDQAHRVVLIGLKRQPLLAEGIYYCLLAQRRYPADVPWTPLTLQAAPQAF
ncbi:MAG: hypothetical protein AAB036_08815 [Elusimicrobiota bacterium]